MNLDILSTFENAKIDHSWTFEGVNTGYITHNYHRYPAKFIPQLAARLINEYSNEGDTVLDPFVGSGTALVESKILARPSVGVDINPVANLITKAKITPIEPSYLDMEIFRIENSMSKHTPGQLMLFDELHTDKYMVDHERIDYWFKPDTKQELMKVYALINEIEDTNIQTFLKCGFSHILKNCSIWSTKSTKPTRDRNKRISKPIPTFLRHIKQMAKRNRRFYKMLKKSGNLDIPSKTHCLDSRDIPIKNESIGLIVTSPPYVTSYEYADLHQLTAFWFSFTKDLHEFRDRFIGTASHQLDNAKLKSKIADEIYTQLIEKHEKTAREVAAYFAEMLEIFVEMWRVLKPGGYACVVIGNTTLKKVDILNAQVLAEQMQNIGFAFELLIMREIVSKILPQTRDKETGRFISADEADSLAYPHEYILVMRKD